MDTQEIPSLWKELLPGIPDEVVLDEIATKIGGKDVNTLSFVSPRWRHEVQCRVVYDARLRRRSTETHVVIRVWGRGFEGLCLYSLSNHTLHQLPLVPNSRFSYQFIAMDGKVYVLGGDSSRDINLEISSRKVYVLDLAGQLQWKECASMLQPRRGFGCGVIDGKIYVFGGLSVGYRPSLEGASEVYDPEVDAWFPIKCMPPGEMTDLIVIPVGEELFVQSRLVSSPLKVYHGGKDEWRVVELRHYHGNIFIFHGEYYSFDPYAITIYDAEESWWRHWCFITCDELGPVESVEIHTKFILPVNNELLANVRWRRADNRTQGYCLLLSCGFENQEQEQEVVWRKAPYSFEFLGMYDSMCLIEL